MFQASTRIKKVHVPGADGRVSGYTLIELVIVITLLGILAAFFAPMVTPLFPVRREAALFKMMGDIRYVRARAISEQVVHGIQVNINPVNTYTAFRSTPATPILDPSRPNVSMVIAFNAAEYAGIQITSVNFGGTNQIRFDANGTPTDANGLNLSANGTVVVSYTGGTSTLRVAPVTGRVSL